MYVFTQKIRIGNELHNQKYFKLINVLKMGLAGSW